MSRDNLEIMLAAIEAFNRRDAESFGSPFAKTQQLAGFSVQADEGIRTLDLRHGKATL